MRRHRLGVNYQKIPVNCPYAARVNTYQRDGNMNVGGNMKGAPNYFPNSFGGPSMVESSNAPADMVSGDIARYETVSLPNYIRIYFERRKSW